MNLKNENTIAMAQFDATFEREETKLLLEHARINIVNDENALINWAINDLLQKHLIVLEKDVSRLKKRKQNVKRP